MRVLLLHPDDGVDRCTIGGAWDLIVDLGRAPAGTYERWEKSTGSSVICLAEFSRGMEDVRSLRELFRPGSDQVVDLHGIDWWEMVKPSLAADFLQIRLLQRLSRHIASADEVWASRADYRAKMFGKLIGREVRVAAGAKTSGAVRLTKCREMLRDLDGQQIAQIIKDKFDPRHQVRRWLAPKNAIREETVLLPSAYIGVSRAAVQHAKKSPERQFLMMYARASARLPHLPANVHARSLDGYFASSDPKDSVELLRAWETLRQKLIEGIQEYAAADHAGVLDQIPKLLKSGLRIRDAWRRVFELNSVAGCFCADDSNIYTRIPLVLAENAGVPSIAAHHGALDFLMAVKQRYEGRYEVKTEMEWDYLVRHCGVAEKALSLSPSAPLPGTEAKVNFSARSFIFFTEPYSADSWRTDEVYREMLPQLFSMTRDGGLRLVFKVHPFESAKGHQQLLRRHLPTEAVSRIRVIDGVMTESLWGDARAAMTAESSVAVECAQRKIPIFLCGWLKGPFSEYQNQFARFAAGSVLERVEDIARVPEMLIGVSSLPYDSSGNAKGDRMAAHSGI